MKVGRKKVCETESRRRKQTDRAIRPRKINNNVRIVERLKKKGINPSQNWGDQSKSAGLISF